MSPRSLVAACLLTLACTTARAGAAEDALALASELQKARIDQDARIAQLEAKLKNQGLLSLLNQIEAMKAEIARLRGVNDELAQQLSISDKRVKDLFADLDARIKELAERPAAPAETVRLHPSPILVAPPPVAPENEAETRSYEDILAQVKAGKYQEAISGFQDFLKQHPNSNLAPNAQYWTGFAQFALSDFKSAAASYQQLLKAHPSSGKAPDAMFSLARSLVQLDDLAGARSMLEQLVSQFPASKAAENAQKLLATLK
jgi:tol-pal system protein YbgF